MWPCLGQITLRQTMNEARVQALLAENDAYIEHNVRLPFSTLNFSQSNHTATDNFCIHL